MFVCCHPAIPLESALALALRTLCGFPVPALSRALRLDEAAVEKRLMRARQVLREEHVELEIDGLADGDMAVRLDGVLRTLYVLFLEGYSAHAGDTQIDEDLCRTAIRLSAMLLGTRFATPRGHALHALFLLQTARLASRVDPAGDLIPLDRQDRTRWDRAMIAEGLEHLGRASTGDLLSPFHLEAAIAACHALAPTYAATDWPQIVALYDQLIALTPSPVIALQPRYRDSVERTVRAPGCAPSRVSLEMTASMTIRCSPPRLASFKPSVAISAPRAPHIVAPSNWRARLRSAAFSRSASRRCDEGDSDEVRAARAKARVRVQVLGTWPRTRTP